MSQKTRLQELDFLRGIAIILVLIRHSEVHYLLVNMGWIGVDLFFVLSGFLVAGLLFREYKKYGHINIKRFLIRRGFKIYPLFYITAIPYLIFKIMSGKFALTPLIGDLVFLQNYVSNWGYLYSPGWSLAVEEHFYLGIALVLFFIYKKAWFKLSTTKENIFWDQVVKTIFATIILIVIIRFTTNIYIENDTKNFTLTHLRIDSLLAGVLLSYLYNFKFELLHKFYYANRLPLLSLAILCLSWTPFISPTPSFFVKTIGFSMLYIGFFIVVLGFVIDNILIQSAKTFFSEKGVSIISKIGVSSYSIYIIHTLINILSNKIRYTYDLFFEPYLYFLITSAISICTGFILTNYVENYFLKVRDKYFPSKATAISLKGKS